MMVARLAKNEVVIVPIIELLIRGGAAARALDANGCNMLYSLNQNNNLSYEAKKRLAEKLYALMLK